MTTNRERAIELEARAAVAERRRQFLARGAAAVALAAVLATSIFSVFTLSTIRQAQVAHSQTLVAIAKVQSDLDSKFVLVFTTLCAATPKNRACQKLIRELEAS